MKFYGSKKNGEKEKQNKIVFKCVETKSCLPWFSFTTIRDWLK